MTDIIDKTTGEFLGVTDQLDLVDWLGGPQAAQLDADGREVPNPTPMAPPLGYKRTPSLAEQIRQMVRAEKFSQDIANQGLETFEEADDFDIGDDFDPHSPYEADFEPVRSLKDKAAREAAEAQAGGAGIPPANTPTEPAGGSSAPKPSKAAKPAAAPPQPSDDA